MWWFAWRHARPGLLSAQLDLPKIESALPMLDLQRLQIFRKVATLRSFSAAAMELSYTQSTVSEAIATLERELGVTLLDRSSRPVRLTPSGEIVLRHAEALLAQASAIETDLGALSSGDVGSSAARRLLHILVDIPSGGRRRLRSRPPACRPRARAT